MSSFTEQLIPFSVNDETFQTYCKVFGDVTHSPNGAIIILHGGPGASHDYLLPTADLALLSPYNAVIFYDQVGTGLSTHLPSKDISFWTIDLFIGELENILAHFNLTTPMSYYNIIGHSWGATLAAEFIVRRQPKGLRKLVLANCLASAKLRNAAIADIRKTLPSEVQEILRLHEKNGTTKSVEYLSAMDVFWKRHGCRLNSWPEEVKKSLKYWPEKDPTVLNSMRKGPENLATGWDITSRIYLMAHIPVLLINGEHDFMADSVCSPFFWGIEKVKWVKFSNSSHLPHWEERERFMEVVGDWLNAL
ncbi:proline-specific peptidase [Dendrothele bispora CBS 962.96]|uniref:Proline-specific peptidase n=1 Tax=Dendrothele bispora (strain CBS 962.96) TaxID=1314807 RepID=A0A4S8M1F6_DENBC|nr:proline-specific peptidase [Dendrothele bispora CBS 962.96]